MGSNKVFYSYRENHFLQRSKGHPEVSLVWLRHPRFRERKMELIKDLFYIESFLFPRVYSVSKAISHCRIPYWQFIPFTVLPSADRYHLSLYVRTLGSQWHGTM